MKEPAGKKEGVAPRRLQRDRHCSLDGLHGGRRRFCRGGGQLIALRTAAGTMYNCRCGEASASASLRAMQPPKKPRTESYRRRATRAQLVAHRSEWKHNAWGSRHPVYQNRSPSHSRVRKQSTCTIMSQSLQPFPLHNLATSVFKMGASSRRAPPRPSPGRARSIRPATRGTAHRRSGRGRSETSSGSSSRPPLPKRASARSSSHAGSSRRAGSPGQTYRSPKSQS